MPARSKAQQRFFAIALHAPGKLLGKMPDVKPSTMREFAETPRKGLPRKVKPT